MPDFLCWIVSEPRLSKTDKRKKAHMRRSQAQGVPVWGSQAQGVPSTGSKYKVLLSSSSSFIIVVFSHIFFDSASAEHPVTLASPLPQSPRVSLSERRLNSVLLSFLVFAVIGDKEEEVSTLEVFVSDQCLAHARTAHRGCVRTRNEIHAPRLKARRWQSGMLLAVPRTRLAALCLGRFARCLQQGHVHYDQTESQNSPNGAHVCKHTTGRDAQWFRARS